MNRYHNYILQSIVALLGATMLFSCQDRLNTVRQWEKGFDKPQTSGKEINLFYTDSGNVKANLRSPKLLDFTHKDFPYREFPEGLEVDFYDENQQKSTVIADYGVIYEKSGLVDLQGNVKVITSDSTILNAKQLYWDQGEHWVFSDVDYQLNMKNGGINNGEGFDANENFDKFNSRSNIGVQYIDETDK